MRRQRLVLLGVVLGLAIPGVLSAQAAAQAQPGSRSRFEGSVRWNTKAAGDSVRVDIRVWSLGGGQTIKAFEVPVKGLMVVELRAGSLTTTIDGRKVPRSQGDFWTVPEGVVMSIETGQDMATLQTTVIRKP